MTRAFSRGVLCATVLLMPLAPLASAAPSVQSNLDKVLSASSRVPTIPSGISEVRAAALKQLGVGLGMRAGLADESKVITAEIEKEKGVLDTKFNFGSLTFPSGALPPVIEEAQDVIAITEYSMRVQGHVYRIVTPATFGQNNWRNYLYLGLTDNDDQLVGDAQRSILPKDDTEKAYWESIVRTAYDEGRKQSRKIFELNLARLERDFNGMRLFYTLYGRGLVSAPKFAAATDSVSRPDPNTIIIGDSVFRISSQPEFNGNSAEWKTTK
ncbi:type IV secretory system conjugative DNA transfer family protein [Massilia orientalis]|uniref:Type IV secretory system conjugative DNA transfer family protein n=1 Tax=Massilia orientalis TaxID=3050128 RepID=A0ACC7MDU4_9BURK|nr:type IV secretory system conjugative DNA transfer family protein [Massilia sp. YIM B02787]